MTAPLSEVRVAYGGVISRPERCSACAVPMMFRLDVYREPVAMFCGNPQCHRWCLEGPCE